MNQGGYAREFFEHGDDRLNPEGPLMIKIIDRFLFEKVHAAKVDKGGLHDHEKLAIIV